MPEGEIHIHRYTICSLALFNARSERREHQGALIRLRHGGVDGYGCIHPWPELGDENLEQTLASLSSGITTRLSARSLECAKADAVARRDGASLFEGLAIPRSHATLMMNADDLATAVGAGFDTVKVKVGRDVASESRFIGEQSGRYPELRWRLDFNGVLEAADVESFVAGLSKDIRARIDFLEDAYRIGVTPGVKAKGACGIPMAVDREVEAAAGDFAYAVIKPAVNHPGPILERARKEGKRVVLTSYMDHPLGQCFAAWEAAKALHGYPEVVDTCGLVTHGLFEPDAFTEALGEPRPDFCPPAGSGLGFDDLLKSLPWEPLI